MGTASVKKGLAKKIPIVPYPNDVNSNYVFQEIATKMVNAVEEIGDALQENASTHLHVHLNQAAQIPMNFVTKRPGRIMLRLRLGVVKKADRIILLW